MRAHEILFEYNRQITIRNEAVRKKILSRMEQTTSDKDILYHWINRDKQRKIQLSAVVRRYGTDTANMPVTIANNYKTILDQMQALNTEVSDYRIDLERLANTFMKHIEQHDTTKTKKYVPWILNQYLKNNIGRLEDMSDIESMLTLYDSNKNLRNFPPDAKDITKLDVNTLRKVVARYNPDDPFNISQNMGKYKLLYGDLDIKYDENNLLQVDILSDVIVVLLENLDASLFFGRVLGGLSNWCTSYIPPRTNMFNYYNEQGKLYAIIPKKPKYENEKYQIHIESDQVKDVNDEDVSISWLLGTRFPELYPVFLKVMPELKSYIQFMDDETLKKVWDVTSSKLYPEIDRISKYLKDSSEDQDSAQKEKELNKLADKMEKFKNILKNISASELKNMAKQYKENPTVYKLPQVARNIIRRYFDNEGQYSESSNYGHYIVSDTYNIHITNVNVNKEVSGTRVGDYIIYYHNYSEENSGNY